ncbi:Uncharacterised protein [Mycobacteroides abscessus subsp. abscessus]|nr:Uncharacterised protein [Mycobacteroides abscessus subsp. abscessus]
MSFIAHPFFLLCWANGTSNQPLFVVFWWIFWCGIPPRRDHGPRLAAFPNAVFTNVEAKAPADARLRPFTEFGRESGAGCEVDSGAREVRRIGVHRACPRALPAAGR